MLIKKEDVLNNLEEVKKYILEAENKKEEKVVGIAIKNRWAGSIIFQSTKTTYKEAVEEANLRGANLSEANLSEADLSGANLRGADLSVVDLSRADLSGANLRGADLIGADLSGANLRGADLIGADLQNAKFYGKTNNPKTLKQNQVSDFLKALGFIIKD